MFQLFSALWISMEYLEGGSLQDLMKTSKSNLDEHTTQWILREMLKVRGEGGVWYPCFLFVERAITHLLFLFSSFGTVFCAWTVGAGLCLSYDELRGGATKHTTQWRQQQRQPHLEQHNRTARTATFSRSRIGLASSFLSCLHLTFSRPMTFEETLPLWRTEEVVQGI